MTTESFGKFFKEKRKALGVSLREFCRENNFDSGNISKLERDLFGAPKEKKKLECFAIALKLYRDTSDYTTFFDLAKVSNKDYGISEIQDQNLLRKLPLLLGTIGDKAFTNEDLDRLIEIIKKAH